ncbi:MAG: hypothetical protein ACLR0N_04805 [Bilophila wadsworthia]
MLLEKFKTAKQPEIQALRQLEYINMLPLPLRIERRLSKRPVRLNETGPTSSRSQEVPRGGHPDDFPPEEAAKQYAEAGASCLSVPEETYQGHAYLKHVRARTAFVAEGLHL